MTLDPARLDANWRAITATLDAPRASGVERVLRRVGVPARITRLVVATPALRRSWYLAMGAALLVGLGAIDPSDPDSLFTLLVLAPLVPVLGVALAYGPTSDPTHEIQLATPTAGIRLVMIRAATVLSVSVVVITVAALVAPAARSSAVLWILPSVALTTFSLSLMTVWPPRRAAAIAGAAWLMLAVISASAAEHNLELFGRVGQLVAVGVAVVAVPVTVWRRDRFDRLEWLR